MTYVKPYWPYFVIGPLCMIVEVIGEVVMPKLLSVVINQGNDQTLTVSGSIGICLAMAGIAVLMMAGGVGGAYFGAKASVNFAADVRNDVYRKIQGFAFANIDRFSTGSLVTRITNDVTQLQNFVNMLLRMALRAPGMLIGGLIMAILLKPVACHGVCGEHSASADHYRRHYQRRLPALSENAGQDRPPEFHRAGEHHQYTGGEILCA